MVASIKPSARVYTSPSIGSTWTYHPYLRPISCNWQLGAFGHAEFRWEYGKIKQPSATSFADVSPLSIDGHLIMIQWTPEAFPAGAGLQRLDGVGIETLDGIGISGAQSQQVWLGIVSGSEAAPRPGAVDNGTQRIFAVAPEILLQRIQITKSWIVDVTATQPEDPEDPEYQAITKVVPYGIAFNAHASDEKGSSYATPNRHTTFNVFGGNLKSNEVRAWKAYEIIRYLINYPIYDTFEYGVFQVPQFLVDDWSLNYVPLNVETHGRNIYDILNAVIDRKRGLIWWLEPIMDTTTIPNRPRGWMIKISTVSRYNVRVTDTDSLLANPRQRDIDFRGKHNTSDIAITNDVLNKYQQVIVEGAPPTVTFSIKQTDATNDWTEEEATSYRLASKAMGDEYNDEHRSDKKTLNDHLRQNEQLKHVFTRFMLELKTLQGPGMGQTSAAIQVEADGNSNPGYAEGANIYSLFPDFEKSWGNKSGYNKQPSIYDENQLTVWHPRLRLERETRLLPRTDYTQAVPTTKYEQLTGEFIRPMVFLRQETKAKWYRLDSMASYASQDELKGKGGVEVSVGLRMHEHQLGFDLVPSDGVSHRLDAEGLYNGETNDPFPTCEVSHVRKGIFAPGDYLTLTLCVNSGCPLRISHPENPDAYQFDQRTPLVINLKDRARLDWVVGGTVYDVTENNTDVKRSKYQILRDDRESMQYLAVAAWTWYSLTRRALQCSVREVLEYSQYCIGTLIKSVIVRDEDAVGGLATIAGVGFERLDGIGIGLFGEREGINTVISSVHIDWVRGATSITTQFSEIDFEGMIA